MWSFLFKNTKKSIFKRNYKTSCYGGPKTGQIPKKVAPRLKNICYMVGTFSLITGLFYLFAFQSEVPFHKDRKRRSILSPNQEKQLGKLLGCYMLSESESKIISFDHPLTKRVTKIGNTIAEENGVGPFHFILLDDPEINAFCTPGNIIIINTGILPTCENTSGLAMILSHEMGHALAGHNYSSLFTTLLSPIIYYSAGSGARYVYSLLLQLPNSRKQEHEADIIGLNLFTSSCFNLEEAVQVFQRMQQATGNFKANFRRTHPGWEDRIALIKELHMLMSVNPKCAEKLDRKNACKTGIPLIDSITSVVEKKKNFLNYDYSNLPSISKKEFEELIESIKKEE